jgi:hypothetical protein
MKTEKNKEKPGVFCIFALVSLIVFTCLPYSGDSAGAATDLSLSQTNQEVTPEANGGQDMVTYVTEKTLFRGHGSSVDDYIVKYEWDFNGDGQYDWESTETGLSYYSYDAAGVFDAVFRITDSHGNFSSDTVKVYVEYGNGKQKFLEKKTTIKKGEQDPLEQNIFMTSEAIQSAAVGDGIAERYVVMINGASESRFWDDVTFMYATLIDDYRFDPESIYLFNYNGTDPSGANPGNMIDYPAQMTFIDNVFNGLGSIMDNDDELFVWITGHGRGYNGTESEYYGYLDGNASIDQGDEQDYLESEFKLRSLYTGGNYASNHGMDVWKVFYKYYASGNYRIWRHKYVSYFTSVYFENKNKERSDSDVFIEKLVDYLEGDYNRNGIIETNAGEVYDYDGDGVPPYEPSNDSFDEDDWGSIDYYDDDVTHINTQVPGDSYIIFDADLDNHLDIDINYDIHNLEVDGTDLDNQGLFDGIDINNDGDMDDWVSIDELIQIYGDKLSDDELAVFLDGINAGVISIFAEPCFSGGFIEDLSSPNRVISTASTEETLSYGNIFVTNFTSAFHGANPSGTPVNADYDGNGLISMLEAFNYAALNGYYNEIPQYDDNGDGISNPYPVPGGGDGDLGANVYLDPSESPAIVDAGPDITITTNDIAITEIQGTVTDTDSDQLWCFWEDAETTNNLTNIMEVTNGVCPLVLSESNQPFDSSGVYNLVVTVFDGMFMTSDSMILTIDPSPAIVDAGPDITITTDDIRKTTITGVVTDADGDKLWCVWEDVETTNNLTRIMNVRPNGDCALDLSKSQQPFDSSGVYNLIITAYDGMFITTDFVILTIDPPN